MSQLTFEKFRETNAQRNDESFPECADWTPGDWATALGGETGETLNFIKKMRRIAATPETVPCNPNSLDQAVEYEGLVDKAGLELADVVTYCDHLARRLGINLEDYVVKKFNIASDRKNSSIKL